VKIAKTNPQVKATAKIIAERTIYLGIRKLETQCLCPKCGNIYPVYPKHFDEDGLCPLCENKYGLGSLDLPKK